MTVSPALQRNGAWLTVAGITVASALIDLWFSGISLWIDEVASIMFAHQPFERLWSNWMIQETNPPLFYTLLKAWVALVGEDDARMRLLTIALAAAAVPLAYCIAQRIAGKSAGILAAILLGFSDAHLYFGIDLRAFGLAQTASLAAVWMALGYLDSPSTGWLKWLAGYVLAAVIALYSHTTLIALVMLLNIFALAWLIAHRRSITLLPLGRWLIGNLLVAVMWAWWGWITLQQVIHPPGTVGWISNPTTAFVVRNLLSAYVPSLPSLARGLVFILGAGAVVIVAWRYRASTALLVPVLAIGGPVLLLILSLKSPVFLAKTLHPFGAFFAISVAIAIAELESRRLRAMAAGFAILSVLVGTLLAARFWEVEPWRQHSVALNNQADAGAIVVAGNNVVGMAIRHYCPADKCRLNLIALSGRGAQWEQGQSGLPTVREGQLPTLLARNAQLIIVTRNDSDASASLRGKGHEQRVDLGNTPRNIPLVTRWTAMPVKH